MSYDPQDTIVAVASAAGGAARGIVRVSGPAAVECVAGCFSANDATDLLCARSPRRLSGLIAVAGDGANSALAIPGELVLWPGARSYTRQPAAEIHMLGSPPLLAAVVEQLVRCGARAALPGEFTLRAFLAGRIDLVQAEGVLGVIDAAEGDELEGALDQLAGGLSRPLDQVRERLLGALAELEAGLDFAEEDIEFIGREQLLSRLDEARTAVGATMAQLAARDVRREAPRAVLAGAANAGKSSLFNALVQRYGSGAAAPAIVSPIAGATRDYLTATLDLDGMACELVDAAGDGVAMDSLAQMGHDTAAAQRGAADLRILCVDASSKVVKYVGAPSTGDLTVFTKSDLIDVGVQAPTLRCSSATGEGVAELAACLRQRILEASGERSSGGATATAARCSGSLQGAGRALEAARELVETGAGAELVAAELRESLHQLGQVVGAVCADDVLDRVFSQFCIGK